MKLSLLPWRVIDEAGRWSSVLFDVAVQATVLILIAALAAQLLRIKPAAVRYTLWLSTLAVVSVLPIFAKVLPGWRMLPTAQVQRTDVSNPTIDQPPAAIPASAPANSAVIATPHALEPQNMHVDSASVTPEVLSQTETKIESPRDEDVATPTIVPRPALLPRYRPSRVGAWIVLTWLVGCLACLVRLAASSIYLAYLGRKSNCTTTGSLWCELERSSGELKLTRPVRLVVGRAGTMPMAWGIMRPCVQLPQDSSEWSATKLRAVLMHELGHIARGDLVGQYLVEIAKAMFWFHPLVWIAAWKTHVEREHACDDFVLNRGMTARDYARQLLDVVAGGKLQRLGLATGIAMASSNKLERRLRSILDESTNRRIPTRRAMLSIVVLSLVAALLVGTLRTSFADEKAKSVATKATPEVQQRVRELIYILRNHRIFTRSAEWSAALRELIQIGKPAVPDLVAELDHSERNVTIRGIAFALRGIGDPRAVPALIRALDNTITMRGGSDCGVYVLDKDLREFMLIHQFDPQPTERGEFTYGRPVNEIPAALVKITGHEETIDDDSSEPAEHWSKWWAQHWSELVTDAEMKSLELPASKQDVIDEAGVAKFGPLFPTGKDVVLGPVHELELYFATFANAPMHVDFDTGKLYQPREGISPKYANAKEEIETSTGWIIEKGIDAKFMQGEDLHLWLIKNSRWDKLEQEIHSGQPLDHGDEAQERLVPFVGANTNWRPDEIGTFLFITREGGRGVMQVFPYEDGSPKQKMRYRMWGDKGQVAAESPVKKAPRNEADWEPERTITLQPPGPANAFMLNFESGEVVTPPASLYPTNTNENFYLGRNKPLVEWCREHGANFSAYVSGIPAQIGGDAEGGRRARRKLDAAPGTPANDLMGIDIYRLTLLSDSYDDITADDMKELAARWPKIDELAWLHVRLEPQMDTWAVITKSGRMGIVQIDGPTDDKKYLKFRYRLLKKQ